MKNDPLIEEIHKVREKYAETFKFDLNMIFADLKRKEQQRNWPKVARKPKRFLQLATTCEYGNKLNFLRTESFNEIKPTT